MKQLEKRHVYVYIQDYLPLSDGSGPYMRAYSNVRAYLDLGFNVEIIHIQTRPQFPFSIDPSLSSARWTHVNWLRPQYGHLLEFVAYRIGRPIDLALNHYFRIRTVVRQLVQSREAVTPGALHHFEYMHTMSAAINYPNRINSIGDFLDFESKFLQEQANMRRELGQSYSGLAGLNYLKRAERMVSEQFRLILTIATHENRMLRDEWGCQHAEFLPTSWATELPPRRTRAWGGGNILSLLHVGRIDSLSSFRSLLFILQEVLPRLEEETLSKIELVVIGEIPNTRRARTILDLAQRYPQVRFLGFQKDLLPYYASADLHLVGTTVATGLRTRIIESFAYGVPVLSTFAGAEGVDCVISEQNILLAKDANAFAKYIRDLVDTPERLEYIAKAGLHTYKFNYSRPVVAKRLAAILNQHIFHSTQT